MDCAWHGPTGPWAYGGREFPRAVLRKLDHGQESLGIVVTVPALTWEVGPRVCISKTLVYFPSDLPWKSSLGTAEQTDDSSGCWRGIHRDVRRSDLGRMAFVEGLFPAVEGRVSVRQLRLRPGPLTLGLTEGVHRWNQAGQDLNPSSAAP